MKTPPPSDATPRAEMLSEEDARRRVLVQVQPLPPENLPLLQATGRFAAAELRATHALPAFDNSAMDGYAVPLPPGSAALPIGTMFRVSGEQPAGPDRGLRVEPGAAVRIFTGGAVPQGTGAVVMQEDVECTGDEIMLRDAVGPGEWIRRAGSDLTRGQLLFTAGSPLTPQRLGLLASQGLASISVGGTPRVAVLATGDELRPAGQPLGPGEIYESNSVLLATLAGSLGASVTVLERARDDRADLDAKLASALASHHVLVVAGGVSVGERDFVKERLAASGVHLDLWRVRIQPGKPFLYGHGPATTGNSAGTHVFGLPGNPVSAFVTFLLFVRPAILRLLGAADDQLALPSFPATTGVELIHRGDRPHYLRGTLDDEGRFTPSGPQESHALFALSRSHALVRVDPRTSLPAGSPVRASLWSL